MANRRTTKPVNIVNIESDVNIKDSVVNTVETEPIKNDIVIDNVSSLNKKNKNTSKSTNAIKKNEDISDVLSKIKNGIKTKDYDITKVGKRERSIIPSDEEISVRSCTKGGFNWVSKVSGTHYRWNDIDDVLDVLYSDLVYMYRNAKHYLMTPNIIIEDERVVDTFKLLVLYTDVAKVLDLEKAIEDKDEMLKICEKANQLKMKELLVDKLVSLIEDEVLTNVNVIGVAKEVLGYQFI